MKKTVLLTALFITGASLAAQVLPEDKEARRYFEKLQTERVESTDLIEWKQIGPGTAGYCEAIWMHPTSNYFYASLAGVLWYVQFLLFGMGKSKMGEYTFIAWGVLMSLTIVFATLWGMYRKEWKNSSATSRAMIWTSIILIMIAAVIMSV